MAPWFAKAEARLGIAAWEVPPNANNAALARGATKLGVPSAAIRRNVRGCWNLGYCGLGCPTNAKQSMLVTTIPVALERGAKLVTRVRADRFVVEGDRVARLDALALDAAGLAPSGRRVTVRATMYVAAAGAIGTPALLLRSALPDPHGLVGRAHVPASRRSSARRACPSASTATPGAPQTIYSDHWLDTLPLDGPIGFKLEAPPIHPVLAAITLPGHGEAHARWMRDLPHMHVQIALMRDGFHPESPGGRVLLRDDGTPVLDYPVNGYLLDGVRRAFRAMADIQFAAGARRGDAGARRRRVVPFRRRGARGDRALRPRRARHAVRVGARDGRRADGQRPAHARSSTRPAATITSATSR